MDNWGCPTPEWALLPVKVHERGPRGHLAETSDWDSCSNTVSPVLAVPAAPAESYCWQLFLLECAGNQWQDSVYRIASTSVPVNDMLRQSHEAVLAVVYVVLATEAHHLEVSKQQWFCSLKLAHSLWWGCFMHACNMFGQSPNFWFLLASSTISSKSKTWLSTMSVNTARYPECIFYFILVSLKICLTCF